MFKFIKIILCCSVLFLIGCRSLNSRFGIDGTDYSDAKELPTLKLPHGSIAFSKRYDIPAIPQNDQRIIDNDMPPDY